MKIDVFFIDFDSTFVNFESLDYVIKIAVEDALKINENDEKLKLIPKKIEEITTLGMEGKIKFKESLQLRISAVKNILKGEHFEKVGNYALENISAGIPDLIGKIKKMNGKVYILSNGFRKVIEKVADKYEIDGIFANEYYTDENNFVVGYDENNFLAGNGGKVKIVGDFLSGKDKTAIMIGDGINDFEVYNQGKAQYFLDFAVNKDRKLDIKRKESDKNFIVCKTEKDFNNFIDNIE